MSENKIPYKIYLSEDEMPHTWYNLRADMKNKPAPLLNPGTLQPMTAQELEGVFCSELVKQELDDQTAYFEIPREIRDFYKMYRPSPLVREQLQCNPESAILVGDRMYDIIGGKTAGVNVIGVLYGYGEMQELQQYGADAIAKTPQDVVEIILNWYKRTEPFY